ncbi:MAG: hypothetical protein IIZ23_07675, partial [Ruminococcus sp.]|nr:hypothetical protein [Ruminococcus sp.]
EELDKITNFQNYVIEQYIEPECDWRVFVMGGTAVGIMRKFGDPEHLDNFVAWSSGRFRRKEDDQDTIEALSRIACRTAAVSRLEYTGVDIIRDKNTKKYYILETNFAAGWMNGFTATTGVKIPELVLDWLSDRGDAKEKPVSVKVHIDLQIAAVAYPQRAVRVAFVAHGVIIRLVYSVNNLLRRPVLRVKRAETVLFYAAHLDLGGKYSVSVLVALSAGDYLALAVGHH